MGRRPPWLFGLTLVAVSLAPFANAIAAAAGGWVPYGDEAVIVTRAYDVGTRLTPLIGMPSSFNEAGTFNPNALGPLQFWALAPFVRVFGPSAGSLVGTAFVNAASIAVVGIVLRRRLGSGAAILGMGACLLAVAYVDGIGNSFRLINSIAPLLPLLATVVLAWAVADGSWKALPVLAVFASYTAQGDAEFTVMVLVLVVWAVATALVTRRHGGAHDGNVHGESVGDSRGAHDRTGTPAAGFATRQCLLTATATAAVAAVCWAGPILDAVRHRGGNLRTAANLLFAHAPSYGSTGASRALGAVLNLPPFVTGAKNEGAWNRGLNATALVPVVAWVLLYLWARKPGHTRQRRLLEAAAVMLLAAGLSGYHLPLGGSWDGNHTVFAQGAAVFVLFALVTVGFMALRPIVPSGVLVVATAVGLQALAKVAGGRAAGAASMLITELFVLTLLLLVAGAVAATLMSRRSGPEGRSYRRITSVWRDVTTPGRWALPCAVALAATLAVLVARPPQLSRTYFAWSYRATPELTRQISQGLRPPGRPPNGYLVVVGGNERYRLLFEAVLLQLRSHHITVMTEPRFDTSYGARRSYPNNVANTAGEIAVLPEYATELPRTAHLLARWQPPGWDSAAKARLDADIAAFVREQGRISLSDSGDVVQVARYALPGISTGNPDFDAIRSDPMLLLAAPGVLTALYQEGWISSPNLPPALQKRLDEFVANGLPVNVWLLPAPRAAAADG